ncbi:hypothetical protein BJ741DRAFT_654239 [Chytriomyces cf. hyalinus JEL632]|nr:hypothetical protein BJ741DRAFT_654239 [Chytriomyces cf. hyalinus JEL632]
MPAVTASFVSMSPQRQVVEAAPSDPTSSYSDPSDPSAHNVECTPVATQTRRSRSSPVPSHDDSPALTPTFWFSEVPRYLQLLRARGVDSADESSQVSETAEDVIVAPRWDSRLLDFGTVPGATYLHERVEAYSQDFSTESVQDLSAFNSACDRVFGSGLDCSGQTIWIQHLIKAEEEFSVGPTFGTVHARNLDLQAGFMKTMLQALFSDACDYEIPREVVYRTLAYFDLIFARSVNIADWDLPDIYVACVHMAELYYSQGMRRYSHQIERYWKSVLGAFRMLSYKRMKLDIPEKILVAAFWFLERVIQSYQVADLPYSIIAAGVFKALYRVIQCIAGLECPVGYDRVSSVHANVMLQGGYAFDMNEVVEPAALQGDGDVVDDEVVVAGVEVVAAEAEVVAAVLDAAAAEAEAEPAVRVKKERMTSRPQDRDHPKSDSYACDTGATDRIPTMLSLLLDNGEPLLDDDRPTDNAESTWLITRVKRFANY